MIAMLRYITYVPALIMMIQAVVSLIESVKKHEPGAEKKENVLSILETNWESASKEFQITVPYSVLKPVISYLIDLTVSVYNFVGHFTKKEATP